MSFLVAVPHNPPGADGKATLPLWSMQAGDVAPKQLCKGAILFHCLFPCTSTLKPAMSKVVKNFSGMVQNNKFTQSDVPWADSGPVPFCSMQGCCLMVPWRQDSCILHAALLFPHPARRNHRQVKQCGILCGEITHPLPPKPNLCSHQMIRNLEFSAGVECQTPTRS